MGDHEMTPNKLKVPSVAHGSGTLPIFDSQVAELGLSNRRRP